MIEVIKDLSKTPEASWRVKNTFAVTTYPNIDRANVSFHDLTWPLGHMEGSLVASFHFSVSSLPEVRCLRVFRMMLVQKRRQQIFSHWLIMKKMQNWPDLRSSIWKFRRINFIHAATHINLYNFQGDRSVGVAMTSILFSDLRSLDVTWWPDLWGPGSEIFTYAKKLYK